MSNSLIHNVMRPYNNVQSRREQKDAQITSSRISAEWSRKMYIKFSSKPVTASWQGVLLFITLCLVPNPPEPPRCLNTAPTTSKLNIASENSDTPPNCYYTSIFGKIYHCCIQTSIHFTARASVLGRSHAWLKSNHTCAKTICKLRRYLSVTYKKKKKKQQQQQQKQ